jgi:hypothetical protein
VPDNVRFEAEVEVDADEIELEFELKWLTARADAGEPKAAPPKKAARG